MDLVRNGDDGNNTEELLAAQAHIWNHIFNFINSMSLKCAVELGIPDIIYKHGRPITLNQLVHSLPINQSKSQHIHRLMRILTLSGFFVKEKICRNGDGEEEETEVYKLTPSSKLLLKDNPLSVTPFLLAMLDPALVSPWHKLSQWFQSGSDDDHDVTPFETFHGSPFWELAGRDDRLNQFFNDGMASDARLVSRVLLKTSGTVFFGLKSMVDVGGGTGTLARAIADAFPHLKCTVLELPHVVDGLKSVGNLAFVEGDMFQSIPAADAVLLKWILHDWSDEECVEILKKCKEAIPSKKKGGKVIILDMVLKEQLKAAAGDKKATETQLFYDMLMMVLVTGKERNEEQWAKLFIDAGFDGYKITPLLGLRSLIEVYY